VLNVLPIPSASCAWPAMLDRLSEAWFIMLPPCSWALPAVSLADLEASELPPETESVRDWPVDFSLSVCAKTMGQLAASRWRTVGF